MTWFEVAVGTSKAASCFQVQKRKESTYICEPLHRIALSRWTPTQLATPYYLLCTMPPECQS